MSVAFTKTDRPARQEGRPRKGRHSRPRFAVSVSPAYQVWMRGLIERTGSDGPSDVVRKALKRYAKALEFQAPPKR